MPDVRVRDGALRAVFVAVLAAVLVVILIVAALVWMDKSRRG